MFPLEQGAFEMLLIGAIALIVVGPKDLPILMRKVGQFTARMRGLAAEFRSSFDEMARQSELDELRKEVEAMRTGQYTAPVSAEIDQHLSDFNPYPSGYPSPPEPAAPEISLTANGEGNHPQGGEAIVQALTFAPDSAVSPSTRAEDEVLAATIKKPRAKKAGASAVALGSTPKPRAPRKPKAAPVAREASE